MSDAQDVGIIQKRIIQNLYDNPIIVCDVSGKNPNVMFELGLRLAFDKPTIIVKDDKTTYSFDTSPIEHLDYPRDLRYNSILDFKEKLAEKISATHKRASEDSAYTTFLKHFGEFTVAKINKKEVSGQEYILQELSQIKQMILRQRPSVARSSASPIKWNIDLCMENSTSDKVKSAIDFLGNQKDITEFRVQERGVDHNHVQAVVKGASLDELHAIAESLKSLANPRRITIRTERGERISVK